MTSSASDTFSRSTKLVFFTRSTAEEVLAFYRSRAPELGLDEVPPMISKSIEDDGSPAPFTSERASLSNRKGYRGTRIETQTLRGGRTKVTVSYRTASTFVQKTNRWSCEEKYINGESRKFDLTFRPDATCGASDLPARTCSWLQQGDRVQLTLGTMRFERRGRSPVDLVAGASDFWIDEWNPDVLRGRVPDPYSKRGDVAVVCRVAK